MVSESVSITKVIFETLDIIGIAEWVQNPISPPVAYQSKSKARNTQYLRAFLIFILIKSFIKSQR